MENKDLFQKIQNGYNCEQVEKYVTMLKTEYKKVFEYAKATEAKNEELKKLCKALSEENKTLKAGSPDNGIAVNSELLTNIARISRLCDEIAKENAVLRSKISK